MKISDLHIVNFMSMADETISLADRGLVSVFGKNLDNPGAASNGAGKSVLWDALAWGLYGKTFRGTGGDDICRAESNTRCKGTMVGVNIRDGDQLWTVRRYRSHPTGKNSLQLICNGNDVSSLNTKETQEKIDAFLGMDYQTFSTTVIFGQGTFRFAQATDSEQKAILDKILGMEKYQKAYEMARVKRNEVVGAIAPLDSQILLSKSSLEQSKSLRESMALRRQNVLTDNEHKRGKVEMAKDFYIRQKAAFPQEIDNLEKEMVKLDERRVQLVALTSTDHATAVRLLTAEAKALQLSIKKADDAVTEAQARMDKIDAARSKCETCGQTVEAEEYKRQYDAAKINLEGRLSEFSKIINPTRNLQVINSELAGAKAKLDEVQPLVVELQGINLAREGHAQRIKEKRSALAVVDTRILAFEKELASLVFDEGLYQKSLQDLEKRDAESMAALEQAEKEKAELVQLLPAFDFWIKGFGPGGIRSYILDAVTPYLNERIEYYADMMFDSTVRIKCTTQTELKSGEKREKFSVEVTNIYGAQMYEGNSAGEKQRIDICIALALQDLARTRASKGLELVIFDEAFERLDEAGCDRVVRILRKKAEDWKSCFVVTHLDYLSGQFDQSIVVTKKGGKSFVDKGLGNSSGKEQREALGPENPELESRSTPTRVKSKA